MFYVKTNVDQPVHFESVGIFLSDDRWRHDRRIIDSYEIIAVYAGYCPLRSTAPVMRYIPMNC